MTPSGLAWAEEDCSSVAALLAPEDAEPEPPQADSAAARPAATPSVEVS